MDWHPENPSILIGISSCLLGERVRYNGDHKRNPFLLNALGAHFTWHPVCPEVELGMGVPREPIRLEFDPANPDSPRLRGSQSRRDWTEKMHAYTEQRLNQLQEESLCGYILKKGSPSCGIHGIRIHGSDKEGKDHSGRGMFASGLMKRFPLLPVADEERLKDPDFLSHFIGAVVMRHRWLNWIKTDPAPRDLVAFHTAQKMTLLAHSRDHYTRLGRLVAAENGTTSWEERLRQYEIGLMEAMWIPATRRKHTDVLQHLAGRLKRVLEPDAKEELHQCLDAYRRELLPLSVPLTLLRTHFRKHPDEWAQRQSYLHPLAVEWKWKRETGDQAERQWKARRAKK
jgi:uncharacterized protein YbbK (DUF523 family)/uncharacterized protein YbgA (DUF1722 family)